MPTILQFPHVRKSAFTHGGFPNDARELMQLLKRAYLPGNILVLTPGGSAAHCDAIASLCYQNMGQRWQRLQIGSEITFNPDSPDARHIRFAPFDHHAASRSIRYSCVYVPRDMRSVNMNTADVGQWIYTPDHEWQKRNDDSTRAYLVSTIRSKGA